MTDFRTMHPVDMMLWIDEYRGNVSIHDDEEIDRIPFYPVFTIHPEHGKRYAYEKTFELTDVSLERFAHAVLTKNVDESIDEVVSDETLEDEEEVRKLRQLDPYAFHFILHLFDEYSPFDFVDVDGKRNACDTNDMEIAWSDLNDREIMVEICEKLEEAQKRKKLLHADEKAARKRLQLHQMYQKYIENEKSVETKIFVCMIHHCTDLDIRNSMSSFYSSYSIRHYGQDALLEVYGTNQEEFSAVMEKLRQIPTLEVRQFYP